MIMLNGKDSFWLQLEVCREYQRSRCTRSDNECKFAHPPTNVEIQSNGRVTACYDSIKGRCQRESCKYMHPPAHLKDQLLINGRNHLALKNALIQQQQQQQQQQNHQQHQHFQDPLNTQLPQHQQQQAALFQSAVAAASAVHHQQLNPHQHTSAALQMNAHNQHLKQPGAAYHHHHLSMQQHPHPAALAAIIASSMNPFMGPGAFTHTYANQYAAAMAAAAVATQQQQHQSPRVISFANHGIGGQPETDASKLHRPGQQLMNGTATNSKPTTTMNHVTQSASSNCIALQNNGRRNQESCPAPPPATANTNLTNTSTSSVSSSSKSNTATPTTQLSSPSSKQSTIKAPPTHYPTPAAQAAAAAAAAAAASAAAAAASNHIQPDQLAAYYMNPAAMAVAAMLGPQANFSQVPGATAYPITSAGHQDPSVHYQSVFSALYPNGGAQTGAVAATSTQQTLSSPIESGTHLDSQPIQKVVATTENRQTSQTSCDKTNEEHDNLENQNDDRWSSGGETKKRVKTYDGSQQPVIESNSPEIDTSHKRREVSDLLQENGTDKSPLNHELKEEARVSEKSHPEDVEKVTRACDNLKQPNANKRPHPDLNGTEVAGSQEANNGYGSIDSDEFGGGESCVGQIERNTDDNANKIEQTNTNSDESNGNSEKHQVSAASNKSVATDNQSANGKFYNGNGTCAADKVAQLSRLLSPNSITTTGEEQHYDNHNHNDPNQPQQLIAEPPMMLENNNCSDIKYTTTCYEKWPINSNNKRQLISDESYDQRKFKKQSFQVKPLLLSNNEKQQQQQQQQQQNGNGWSKQLVADQSMVATRANLHYRSPSQALKLEVCREFLRNSCKRSERNCKFAHPPAHVLMRASSCSTNNSHSSSVLPSAMATNNSDLNALSFIGGAEKQHQLEDFRATSGSIQSGSEQHFVTVCMDFMKGRCSRSFKCRYLHPTTHLQCQLSQARRTNTITTAPAAASPMPMASNWMVEWPQNFRN